MNTQNNKGFDDYRNLLLEDYHKSNAFLKKKFSQGAYWTILDKDLANQYFRDEVWFMGVKIKDNIKFIDHGSEEEKNKGGIGFNIKTK